MGANISTRAAVIGAGVGVYTSCRSTTRCFSRRTGTSTSDTSCAFCTSIGTCATMRCVGLSIHAGSAAVGLTGGTVLFALSCSTTLTCQAFVIACTTVSGVRIGLNACTITKSFAGGAFTFPCVATLSGSTCIATGSAVFAAAR